MVKPMVKIEVESMKEAVAFFQEENIKYQDATDKAVFQSALAVETEVKRSIAGQSEEDPSVDTGRFLNSVWTQHTEKYVAIVQPGVDYAQYLEEGHRSFAGRHHFKNSLERMRDKIPSEFNAEFEMVKYQ